MKEAPVDRSLLKYAAVVLFILAAVFLFAIESISVETDLGLVACGLAAWAAS
jgi:hypothetical protein